MQFTKNRNALLKPSSFFTIIVFILVVLLIVFNQIIGSFLGNFVSILSFSKVTAYETLPKSVLASRLLDAEEELSRIKYQSLLYTINLEEIKSIKESLGLTEQETFLRANIIARPPRTHYDTFLISYDNKNGLEVGDLAFISGIYIGFVSEVREDTALVSLLSSPGVVFDVRAGDPSAIVVTKGLGGGSFTFDIPKEVNLNLGDIVSTGSGESNVIAIVSSISETPEHTTSKVYANSPVNMNTARIIEFKKAKQ